MEKIKRGLNIFRAVFIMQMKIYFRYPINFFMTLIDPIIWLAPIYFMSKCFSLNGKFPGFEKYAGNSDYMGFVILGFMVSTYVWTVSWSMGFALKEEMTQGVLESNWSAPVSRIGLLISKSAFQFCVATFEIILTGISCYFVFGFTVNANIFKALLFITPGVIGLLGLGLAISSAVLLLKEANTIIDIGNNLVIGFSGGYFPLKVLPKWALFISSMIPLTYMYDSTRAILLEQNSIMPLSKEFLLLICSMVGFCLMGALVFNTIEKRCRTKGILGTH